jgi:hypothetical protein
MICCSAGSVAVVAIVRNTLGSKEEAFVRIATWTRPLPRILSWILLVMTASPSLPPSSSVRIENVAPDGKQTPLSRPADASKPYNVSSDDERYREAFSGQDRYVSIIRVSAFQLTRPRRCRARRECHPTHRPQHLFPLVRSYLRQPRRRSVCRPLSTRFPRLTMCLQGCTHRQGPRLGWHAHVFSFSRGH